MATQLVAEIVGDATKFEKAAIRAGTAAVRGQAQELLAALDARGPLARYLAREERSRIRALVDKLDAIGAQLAPDDAKRRKEGP